MKKFNVYWGEIVTRVASIEADSEQEAEDKFYEGDIEGEICSVDFYEDSLEINEEDEGENQRI